jgi:hypothetical protein
MERAKAIPEKARLTHLTRASRSRGMNKMTRRPTTQLRRIPERYGKPENSMFICLPYVMKKRITRMIANNSNKIECDESPHRHPLPAGERVAVRGNSKYVFASFVVIRVIR